MWFIVFPNFKRDLDLHPLRAALSPIEPYVEYLPFTGVHRNTTCVCIIYIYIVLYINKEIYIYIYNIAAAAAATKQGVTAKATHAAAAAATGTTKAKISFPDMTHWVKFMFLILNKY